MRRLFVALLVVLGMLAPHPAWGIVYGEPDNGEHPNVGSFVGVTTDPGSGEAIAFQLCTGTLIDPGVVVSASHCFVLPDVDVFFTFDEVIDANRDGLVDPSVDLLSGETVIHPLYGGGGQSDPHDIAVFLLDVPVIDIQPATLPQAGLLDTRSLRSATFTAVGYGAVRETNRKAFTSLSGGWRREQADQHINSVTKAWVTFSMNQATGNGGTCYGDSGGPHFLGDVIVSVTVTGDAPCKATDRTYRLDTATARQFLAQYVSVP